MNKHTPGPWEAHFDESYFVTGPDLGRVAMMMNLKGKYGLCGRRSGNESAANCRLIAAAPDLLEALQLAHKALDAIANEMTVGERYTNAGQYLLDSLEPSRVAIAKATGEQ